MNALADAGLFYLLFGLSSGGARPFDEANAITHDELVQSAVAKAGFKIGKLIFGWAVSKTLEANGLSMFAAII